MFFPFFSDHEKNKRYLVFIKLYYEDTALSSDCLLPCGGYNINVLYKITTEGEKETHMRINTVTQFYGHYCKYDLINKPLIFFTTQLVVILMQ